MNAQDVLREVCREYGVTFDEVKGPSRKKRLADARHMFFLLMRYKMPVGKIAAILNRHYSIVYYAYDKMAGEITIYSDARNHYINIQKKLTNEDQANESAAGGIAPAAYNGLKRYSTGRRSR